MQRSYNKDYYEILGIEKNSTIEEIKKAYRDLAIKWHPDKNNNSLEATDVFQQIQEAYEILGNSSKRPLYDDFWFSASDPLEKIKQEKIKKVWEKLGEHPEISLEELDYYKNFEERINETIDEDLITSFCERLMNKIKARKEEKLSKSKRSNVSWEKKTIIDGDSVLRELEKIINSDKEINFSNYGEIKEEIKSLKISAIILELFEKWRELDDFRKQLMKNYEERGISKILVEHNRFFVRHREHFLRINRSHNKHYRRDKGKIEKIIGEEGTKKILKIQEQIFKLEKDIQRFEKNKENNPRLRKMLDMIEDSKNSIIFKNNSNKKEKEGIENEKCAFLEQYYYQD